MIVKIMLIKREAAHPTSKKTPKGGNIKAKINLKISENVHAILCVGFLINFSFVRQCASSYFISSYF